MNVARLGIAQRRSDLLYWNTVYSGVMSFSDLTSQVNEMQCKILYIKKKSWEPDHQSKFSP